MSSGTLQRLTAAVLAWRAPTADPVQVLQCSQIPGKAFGSFRNLSGTTQEGALLQHIASPYIAGAGVSFMFGIPLLMNKD